MRRHSTLTRRMYLTATGLFPLCSSNHTNEGPQVYSGHAIQCCTHEWVHPAASPRGADALPATGITGMECRCFDWGAEGSSAYRYSALPESIRAQLNKALGPFALKASSRYAAAVRSVQQAGQ